MATSISLGLIIILCLSVPTLAFTNWIEKKPTKNEKKCKEKSGEPDFS